MKLAQFKSETSTEVRLGISIGERLFDVGDLARSSRQAGEGIPGWLLESPDMLTVIRRGPPALKEIDSLVNAARSRGEVDPETGLAFDSIEFLPAVNAGKILAIGRNYADHAKEGGAALPEAPLLFNKLPNSLNAHNSPIRLPAISKKVDFEAELAVVIGRQAKRLSEA